MATFTGRKAGRQAVGWTAAAVLHDGAALYLMGRFLFLRLTTIAPLRQLVAVGAVLVLLPVGRLLPAPAALGLLAVLLVAVIGNEWATSDARAARKTWLGQP